MNEKVIALEYLNTKKNAGVSLMALASAKTMRVFPIDDVIDFINRYPEVFLRSHDGVRLRPFSDAPRKREVAIFYTKAVAAFKLEKNDSVNCELAVADFYKGVVTGGSSNCLWDVVTAHGAKIEVKGIGGLLDGTIPKPSEEDEEV